MDADGGSGTEEGGQARQTAGSECAGKCSGRLHHVAHVRDGGRARKRTTWRVVRGRRARAVHFPEVFYVSCRSSDTRDRQQSGNLQHCGECIATCSAHVRVNKLQQSVQCTVYTLLYCVILYRTVLCCTVRVSTVSFCTNYLIIN